MSHDLATMTRDAAWPPGARSALVERDKAPSDLPDPGVDMFKSDDPCAIAGSPARSAERSGAVRLAGMGSVPRYAN